MKTHQQLRHLASALTLAAFATVLATACGSSDDNPNPDIVGDSGIATTDSAKDTTTTTDTSSGSDTTPGDSVVSETVADSTDASWDPDSGLCFPGDPTTDIQFFDKCTSATCIPYDNKKLTKLNADGTLPALP